MAFCLPVRDSRSKSFIVKEIWINESKPWEVTSVMYWNTYKEWKAIPKEELMATVREFDEAFGVDNYTLVGEYHKENRWFRVLEYR